MKALTISCLTLIMMSVLAGCSCTSTADTRDYAYESYCDSIWEADPDYYMDVLVESDEYQNYIEQNGEWF